MIDYVCSANTAARFFTGTSGFFVVTLDHNSLIPIPCSISLLITNTIAIFVYQCDFDSFYYLIIISFSNSSSLLSSIRIQWLRKGSRELFGTIIEDQVRFFWPFFF